MMLAMWFGASGLVLSEDESERMAAAIKDVTRHYEFAWLDDRTTDWINLLQVAGGVYGPRVAAWWMNRTPHRPQPTPSAPQPAPQSAAGGAATVSPVPPGNGAAPRSGKVMASPGPGLPPVILDIPAADPLPKPH
jgi:hypothetical protein